MCVGLRTCCDRCARAAATARGGFCKHIAAEAVHALTDDGGNCRELSMYIGLVALAPGCIGLGSSTWRITYHKRAVRHSKARAQGYGSTLAQGNIVSVGVPS